MGRQKVAPENRQRTYRACRPCKASKKRCDSSVPCASCVRRHCTAACVYDPPSTAAAAAVVRTPPRRRSLAAASAAGSAPPPTHGAMERQPQRQPDPTTATTMAVADTPSSTAVVAAAGADSDGRPRTPEHHHQRASCPPGRSRVDTMSQATTLGPWSQALSDSEAPGTEAASSAHADPVPEERMMLDAKGEKFYFGDAAGVSFLQFMRRVVLQNVGPCPFTDDKRGDVILEVAIPDDGRPFQPALGPGACQTFVDSFFIATSGIIDVYGKEQTLRLVQNLGRRDGIPGSIGCLVVAIGTQCIVTSSPALSPAECARYFKRGQQLAFQGMLEDLSVDVVYAFVLMSFYLLGACRRNTAFLYIGIAARAAHALGLHTLSSSATTIQPGEETSSTPTIHPGEETSSRPRLSREERSQRIRVWESLRAIDLMVASVLCRPAASLAHTCRAAPPSSSSSSSCSSSSPAFLGAHDPANTRHLALYANVQLCAVLEDIVQHLDQKRGMRAAAAEQFLGRLQRWSASLPSALRSFSVPPRGPSSSSSSSPTGGAPGGSQTTPVAVASAAASTTTATNATVPIMPPADHETAVGSLRVACLYYFAVIQVTRPALISHLLARLELDNSSGSHQHPTPPSSGSCEVSSSLAVEIRLRETAKLGRVCVDAAVLMANLCRDALRAGLLLDNMCMLKAWIFSASLILGFSDLAPAYSIHARRDIHNAFGAAVDTLRRLAHPSGCPQAEHYVSVLQSLDDAVTKHHLAMANARQRGSSMYVSQILVIERPHDHDAAAGGGGGGGGHGSDSGHNGGHQSNSENQHPHFPLAPTVAMASMASPADPMAQQAPGGYAGADKQHNGMHTDYGVGGAGGGNGSAGAGWFLEPASMGNGMLPGLGGVMDDAWGRIPDLPPLGEDGMFAAAPFQMIFDDI